MRITPLFALAGTVAAAEQPGMMDKVTNWFTNMKTQIGNTITHPIDAGASAVAGAVVQPLGMSNWKEHLMPRPDEPQEWMVYMTGGNKTCYGRCEKADRAWNVRLSSSRPVHTN
jgi:hypothetical protein